MCTPREFLDAVEREFGLLAYDVACTRENSVAPNCLPIEEGSSLERPWPTDGLIWCNPPFRDLSKWAAKAACEATLGGHTLLLAPASMSTKWMHTYCQHDVVIHALRPRIRFVGHDHDFPKDLVLIEFTPATPETVPALLQFWHWKKSPSA